MKTAAIAYALLILIIGLFVTAVMTRETETEKEEAHAEQEAAAKKPKAPPGEIAPGAEIAERVVAIRGAQFDDDAPEVQVVPREELEKKLAALDQEPPQDPDLAAGAAILLAQAGALPAEQAEQLVNRRYGGTGVLSAYLPEEQTVLVDEELAGSDPETAEAVAAAELSRALDTAGSEAPRVPPLFRDDEAARVALQGGAAALLAEQYAERHLGGDINLAAARDSRIDPETPPAVETLARFPHTTGRAFMTGAHRAREWQGVDQVLSEPPDTTSELLHADAPEAVPAPQFVVKAALGEGWKRMASADVGELDTVALLRNGNTEREAFKAAAGWRSGRFETWIEGGAQCPPPCRAKGASIVVHRWGDVADALTFTRGMRIALTEGAQARAEGGRGFTIDGGGAALVRAGRFTALTFAPDAPTAGSLAEQALEG